MNSMYPSVMCMKLPTGEFEYLDVTSKTLEEWIEFFRQIEEELNSNLTLEDKYNIKFENEPEWKQGEYCYFP